MSDDLRNLLLGLAASAVSAALGWLVRTYVWRGRLRRQQRFFGMPTGSECLLVVPHDASGGERTVARHDVFALLELTAVIKECGAHAEISPHDAVQQGVGARAEVCVGGPAVNRRTAAHLRSLLPGVTMDLEAAPGPDRAALTVDGETYRLDSGVTEYVLLARVTVGEADRPVFLVVGQRAVANQAAVRHLARHHAELAGKYGVDGVFCLLLKVVNSQAYGPDVVELVADVTRSATVAPAPAPTAVVVGRPHVGRTG